MRRGLNTRNQSVEVRDSAVFSFADYLQLACMTRRSVHLSAIKRGQTLGGVIILTGDVWHAWDEFGEGTDAFKRLAMTDCEVSVMPHSGSEPRRTVSGSWERLMMDAAVEQDELSRSVPPPAPSQLAPVASGFTAAGPPTITDGDTHTERADEAESGVVNNQTTIETGIDNQSPLKAVDVDDNREIYREQPASQAPAAANSAEDVSAASRPAPALTHTTLLSPLAKPSLLASTARIRLWALATVAVIASVVGWVIFLDMGVNTDVKEGPISVARRVVPPTIPPPELVKPKKEPAATTTVARPTAQVTPVTQVPESSQVLQAPVAATPAPPVAKLAIPTPPIKRKRRRGKRQSSPSARKASATKKLANASKKRSVNSKKTTTTAPSTEASIKVADKPQLTSKVSTVAVTRTKTATKPKPSEPRPDAVSKQPAPSSKTAPVKRPRRLGETATQPVAFPSPPKSNLRAQVRILGFKVIGPPSADKFGNTILRARQRFANCYRQAALAAGQNAFGKVRVQVVVNGGGYVSSPVATGGRLLGLNQCVAGVAGNLRTRRRAGTNRLQLKWTVNYVP